MEDHHAGMGMGTVEVIRLKRQGRMGESLHLEVKQHLLAQRKRPVAQPSIETLDVLGPADGHLTVQIALKVDRFSCPARDLQESAFVKGFTRFLGEVRVALLSLACSTSCGMTSAWLTMMPLSAERDGPGARVHGPAHDRRNDRHPLQ